MVPGLTDEELDSVLARLGVVYADKVRMKAVTEAYTREISPKLFSSEFGGGSVPRVSQHFDRLVETDWLVLSRTETGGARRGATEHFYRANELVIFEEEVWAALPSSVRAQFTWMTFEQLTERASAAITSGTFDARDDRHLTWTPMLLDEQGWKRVLKAADVVFRTVLEEQAHAKSRLRDARSDSMLATVALLVFESPIWPGYPGDWVVRPYISGHEVAGRAFRFAQSSFFPRFSRVLLNPVDRQIIEMLNKGEVSPTLLNSVMPDIRLPNCDRRLKKLSRQGWAAQLARLPDSGRGSSKQSFYRAVGPTLIDNDSWVRIPQAVRTSITSQTFEEFREKVKEAVAFGTFDARVDRHLTWSLLRLDEVGWKRVVGLIDDLFEMIFGEEAAAKVRMERSGERPLLATVGLAAFESPTEVDKAP